MNIQCPTLKHNLNKNKKECDAIRIYIFDFSFDFLTSEDFYGVKYLLKESIKNWFNTKIGTRIKIGRIDRRSLEDLQYSSDGFKDCENSDDCFKFIDKLKYENVAQNDWNNTELVFSNINVIFDYSSNLSTILTESFTQCPFNSAILLTNRIVDMSKFQNITEIRKSYCAEFSVILLGRNESDATEDLMKYFDFIPDKFTFNVPDYNCVTNLVPCILKFDLEECSNMTLNSCPAIPTTTPVITTTTSESFNTFHVTYILGFSQNVNRVNFDLVLHSLLGSVQEVIINRKMKINFIVSSKNVTQNIQFMQDFENFIASIDVLSSEYMDDEEFINRINIAIEITQFQNGAEKRMILLTDYFPSNMSENTNNYEILKNNNLHIFVYNYSTYELYENNNITSNYLSNYSSPIPLIPTFTSTTLNATTTTTPKPSTQNDKEKTIIIIIICSIIGSIFVILLISLFFYRRRQQRKRIEEITKSHQNPENIDEWELTWDKIMIIKNEELGSGAFGQVLQGKLLGIQKSKNGKLIEEKENVAIKILQRYTNVISEKNFLNEIQTMKLINGHKNIVKMIGCITVGDRICLVLEFCPHRDLLQYSKTKNTELLTFLQTVEHIKKEFLIFAWQISHGMQFLASEGIIHRDLAARNILINEFKIAKISDFGLSVQINDKHKNSPTNNILQIETGKLPVKWLAIESLKNYEFSLQSDIWSFGIILYEMYSFGKIPFSEIEVSQLLEYLEAGNRPEKPEICSEEIYTVMLKCWNSSPSFRPLFDELITIFTVFLEHSTENYGYLDLIKSGINR